MRARAVGEVLVRAARRRPGGGRPLLRPATDREAGLARVDAGRLATLLGAPLLALAIALAIAAVALLATGQDPLDALVLMLDFGVQPRSVVEILNQAVPLYLAGVAVAIGFQMGLFNIGVDGQYRIAALMAAGVAGYLQLPGALLLLVTVAVGIAAGAAWAGIAGLLKVTRGVNEVISTIMLNYIATGLGAYLLGTYLVEEVAGSNNIATPPVPEGARPPAVTGLLRAVGVDAPESSSLTAFVGVAVVVGVAYGVVLRRTRFGFELRASGASPSAAAAGGVDSRRMILVAMLLSGAVAGVVGLSQLLVGPGTYSLDFPTGYGFTGIAVALLGRNHPAGIAVGALLFAFLDRSSQILQLEGIPREVVTIMQGSIVLAVVVAYEVIDRFVARREEQAVLRALEAQPGGSRPDDAQPDGARAGA